MTKPDPWVTPEADAFGFRVNPRTPLAHVVAVLKRHNPRASFAQIKNAAETLRRDGLPTAESEVSREPRPGLFDSGADSGATNSAPVSSAPESEVAVEPDGEPSDGPERHKPSRAEVAEWVAKQSARARRDLPMSSRGRIPAATLAAYRAAHRDEVMASMVPVEGGSPMPAEVPPEPEQY